MIVDARIAQGDRHDEAGFTLVELLAVLTLLSLLCLALVGSLRFGIKAWERGTTHSDRVDHSTLVQNLLRRIVGDAYPLFLLDDPTHPHIDFDGTRESLSFLAPAPMALGGSGRSRFVLSVARRGDRSDLVLTSRPELADRDASSTPVRRTLLADAQAIDFSYLGRARSARGPEWHDRWSGETVLPRLVRIRVRLASGNTRLWPELLIAPHIAVDVGCVYDPLTTQCRGR